MKTAPRLFGRDALADWPGGALVTLVVALMLGGLLIADRATPGSITFGSLALIVAIAAGVLLSRTLLTVVLIIGVVTRAASVDLAGVHPVTAGVQSIALVAAGTVAYLAAEAVRSARLDAESSQRLTAIVAAATEMAGASLSQQDLVGQLLLYSVLVSGAERGDVARIEGEDLVVEAAYDSSGTPLEMGSRRKIATRPLVLQLLEKRQMVRSNRGRDVIAFPLVVEGSTHGVLTLICSPGATFKQADLAGVEQVATIASLVLHGAGLYEQMRKAREEAEAAAAQLRHDIAAREQAEAQLQQMTGEREAVLREHVQRMESLERLKSEFLLLASHELRGPLSVLMGYISLMDDGALGELPEPARKAVHAMQERAQAMSRLTEDLLQTARVEHGLQLDLKLIDLRDVAKESVRSIKSGRDARIATRNPSNPVPILGDRDRLVIILNSMLDNAIKYGGRDATITTEVSVDDGWGVAAVHDNGPGIREEDLSKLFTRFGRLVTSENAHIPGTGLGLYLAQNVAHMHSGRITVVSEHGKGSTFALRIPLAKSAEGAPVRSSAPSARTDGR
ncbi:MAG TPA: ATP-binding protein [Candidatus Dormibacteraeota bacterium]|nr:ATP-binding protein [Candidatus Dormibacteraeota bacterium]